MPQSEQQVLGRVAERKLAKDERVHSDLAFSIPEFCRRDGISRAHFYNLALVKLKDVSQQNSKSNWCFCCAFSMATKWQPLSLFADRTIGI